MRTHRRRDPLDHVLVAATYDDLAAVRALLVLLPETAYGQVYVEAGPGQPLPTLATPARVTVSVLPRTRATPPGALLAGVVDAWTAEWIPDEPTPDRAFATWVSADARALLDHAGEHLETL